MARYIEWDDVTNRYKTVSDIADDSELQESYIQYAEAHVDAALAPSFSIPFSNNNATVKDLCIDLTFAKTQMFKDSEKAEKIMTHVNSVIGALKEGGMIMVVGSGETIAANGEPVYSSNQNYNPVFGKGDITNFRVDSSQLADEEFARE